MNSTLTATIIGEFYSTGSPTWWILLNRAPDLVNYTLPFTGFGEFYSNGLRTWRILLYRAPDLVNYTLPFTGFGEFYSTGLRTWRILLSRAPDLVNSTLPGTGRWILLYRATDDLNFIYWALGMVNYNLPSTGRYEFYGTEHLMGEFYSSEYPTWWILLFENHKTKRWELVNCFVYPIYIFRTWFIYT